MNMTIPKCPDCKTAMVAGEVLYTPNGLAHHAVEWLEREAASGSRSETKSSSSYRREIIAFRCPQCGLLKGYAS